MKFAIVLVFGLFAVALGRPDTVFDFEGKDHEHQQEGEPRRDVEGQYNWESPEGKEFYVKYRANEDGYVVLDSNAVPIDHEGVAADGEQVSRK